jgi:hypothetical protein
MALAGQFANASALITAVHSNTDQEIIQITEDRLRLALGSHLKQAEKRLAWVAPLGILLTIILAFVTAEFKPAFGLEAAVWKAIFILAGVGSLIWFIRDGYQSWNAKSIDDIISAVKSKKAP